MNIMNNFSTHSYGLQRNEAAQSMRCWLGAVANLAGAEARQPAPATGAEVVQHHYPVCLSMTSALILHPVVQDHVKCHEHKCRDLHGLVPQAHARGLPHAHKLSAECAPQLEHTPWLKVTIVIGADDQYVDDALQHSQNSRSDDTQGRS